jgi:hypothetical protein
MHRSAAALLLLLPPRSSTARRRPFAPAARIDARPGGEYAILFSPEKDPQGLSHGTKGALWKESHRWFTRAWSGVLAQMQKHCSGRGKAAALDALAGTKDPSGGARG